MKIKSQYKDTPLLKVIEHYRALSDEQKDELNNKEKELLTYYENHICIK
tara:strand:- start:529 stop:675 length:147 start_codon:yes stop_codon:yes gene_type:complete